MKLKFIHKIICSFLYCTICVAELRVDAQTNGLVTPQTQAESSIAASSIGTRPNIIHIIIYDIGYDDFSSYGSLYYKTQHIDALAKEGTRLTNF